MNDGAYQLYSAIQSTGMKPPDIIVPGKMHRFPGIGKHGANNAGWCILFIDGLGGSYGDWGAGFSENWQAKQDKPFSYAERIAFKRRIETAQVQIEVEQEEKYAKAAEIAVEIWNSGEPAMFHDYLKRKQVLPLGIKVDQFNKLLIPLMDGEEIHSLQTIQPDGTKRFLKGGKTKGMCYQIKPENTPDKLLLCEGFSTSATLHMETKLPVTVAFCASNLAPIGRAMRKQYPAAELLICGDNDHAKEGNPGKQAAIGAARACGGKWTIPDFTGLNPAPNDSDFNDLYRLQGVNQ